MSPSEASASPVLETLRIPTSEVSLTAPAVESFLAGELPLSAFLAIMGEPKWGPIGQEVYDRTYSRTLPDGTKEHWAETVRRVVNGNLGYAPETSMLHGEAIDLFTSIYDFKLIPAGRHLYVTGTKTSGFSRNCWVSGFSGRTSDHFRFLSSRLFEGGGVGSNYSNDLMELTSPLVRKIDLLILCDQEHPDFEAVAEAAGDRLEVRVATTSSEGDEDFNNIEVPDTREGWSATYARLIDIAQGIGMGEGIGAHEAAVVDGADQTVIVDVSAIRPAGAELRTFGGTASGPAPLVSACIEVVNTTNAAAGRRLSGLEAMDIDHSIAASVVAGGTRRAARLAAMLWSDEQIFDFIACKSDPSKHWTANISVEVDDVFREALADPSHTQHGHAAAVMAAVTEGMVLNGEPGFIDTSFASADEPGSLRICNPCGEVFLATADFLGSVGAAGESCNLGSVNLAAFGSDSEAIRDAYRLLARFLYRSTLNAHADPEAGMVEARNRRLGAGFMGLQDWTLSHGTKLSDLPGDERLLDLLSGYAAAAREAADDLADSLSLPRPVKVTAVAPTGSIAQMPGVTPSLQAVMARYFIRRVRYSDHDPALAELAAAGHKIEDDIYAAATKCVEFVVQDSILGRFPEQLVEQGDEISFAGFMSLVAAIQGSFCGPGVGNAVSSTAAIPQGMDPKELAEGIEAVLGKVKGVTAFPNVSRPQSPYEPITRERFDAYVAEGYPVSLAGDSNTGECGPAGCPIR